MTWVYPAGDAARLQRICRLSDAGDRHRQRLSRDCLRYGPRPGHVTRQPCARARPSTRLREPETMCAHALERPAAARARTLASCGDLRAARPAVHDGDDTAPEVVAEVAVYERVDATI